MTTAALHDGKPSMSADAEIRLAKRLEALEARIDALEDKAPFMSARMKTLEKNHPLEGRLRRLRCVTVKC